MKTILALAALAAAFPAVAYAQDATAPAPEAAAPAPDAATAPMPDETTAPAADTTAAPMQDTASSQTSASTLPFGFQPYIAVIGGYDAYDSDKTRYAGYPYKGPRGAMISGEIGADVPVGPVFAGVSGNVGKGFKDLDWEYGVAGRVGIHAGDSMVFVKAGYEWTNFDNDVIYRGKDHRKGVLYGVGSELSPSDFGMGQKGAIASHLRLRLAADTDNFKDIRPNAGIVYHF